MNDSITALVAAALVGGLILFVARRTLAGSPGAEPAPEPAYGDLAAHARSLQRKTVPDDAADTSSPVLRARPGGAVVITWSFVTAVDWASYLQWLLESAPTGFRPEGSDATDVARFVSRPTIQRREQLTVTRSSKGRVDVQLTIEVDVQAE